MAVKFKLMKQKNLGKDKDVTPEKVYAREVNSDKISFEYLLEEIAAAGIPSNQVKGVMDRMNYLIRLHLSAGHIVQFGELGNFRYTLGSTGAVTEEEFETTQIKTPRLLFYPGKTLQKARKNAEFQRLDTDTTDESEEDEGGGDGF
ncbi:putative histone-like DNA-binding protein [Parabacteroides sp. PFB2-12]|uniref:HU family DNA-binding protein n=1 Tax=unclassified Parabacteroides TaxID=2649774 RepID=UPI0024767F0E|nr:MULTISPECIES: DNA-binding protein [unclassified Parabacteroides]MDH6341814.1 putative histone-like DNA-binding protein [Parabacteroides sp. PM6-13]MDH6391647.1 putative histone-like DNA-binding protein [Parabacteroides sp. PFB2-12]